MPSNAALRVTKNVAALSAGRASVMLFTFGFVVYAARSLGVEDFGKYALVRGYFELFQSLCATGLSIVITREIAKRPSWAGRFLSAAVFMVLALALAANVLLAAIGRAFGYAPDTQEAMLFASLALFPAVVALVLEGSFVAFERAEFVTFGTVLENALRTALSLGALMLGYGVPTLFAIFIATRVVLLLFYLTAMHHRVARLTWHFDWGFVKELARDWRVFALENWMSNLFLSVGTIMLSYFLGERGVGSYAAVDRVMSVASLVAVSYTNAIFPHLSRSYEESRERFWSITEQSVKYLLATVLPMAVVVAATADWLVRLLYTDAYAASIPILQVLVWVLVLKFVNPFLSFVLFARGEQRKSLQVAAASLAIYLGISALFIPRWGGVGAAWSLLLAMSAAFCLYFYFVFGREGAARVLWPLGRLALAGGGLAAFVVAFRDVPMALLLGSSALVYLFLFFVLRVPSSNDVDMFQRMALMGLRKAGRMLGRA